MHEDQSKAYIVCKVCVHAEVYMKSFIRLTDFQKDELLEIYEIADHIEDYAGSLKGKTVVLFFPASSIRTRVSFEKGIALLGGHSILFDPTTLEKKEDIRDVCGYLQNWADALIVRHKDICLLEKMAGLSEIPVINAMTDENHPCEVLSDLYALSKRRKDFLSDQYLFAGGRGNIGNAWKEAAVAFGFSLSQCCPEGYEIPGVPCTHDLKSGIKGKDIVCTDSIPKEWLLAFRDFQITKEIMELANDGALLNPCPPFYRGEEVSEDVMDSDFFVGYDFKKYLLVVQQAVLLYCLSH